MFTKTQLVLMLDLQNKMNTKVNPEWLTAGNDWTLASMMEAVEGIGHHGWKWWKKQNPDMSQLKMELVDIWHFMLSEMIVSGALPTVEDLAQEVKTVTDDALINSNTITFNNTVYTLSEMSIVDMLKLFTAHAAVGTTPIVLFANIMDKCGMPSDELYTQYLGKNVLSFFRQDNGYKDGTYIKIWFDGREDNEHLVDILKYADLNSENVDKNIYAQLELEYAKNTQ
jgi:dimeric dUTPase (all-alpha-NTP-PPase superfamily)